MRIAKADDPTTQIEEAIAAAREKGHVWWRTAANAVYSEELLIFGVGDSSGAWGVLFSEEVRDADDIPQSEFEEHRPDGWTTDKMPSRYARITGGTVRFIPRNRIMRANGEPLEPNALRTNVMVDLDNGMEEERQ